MAMGIFRVTTYSRWLQGAAGMVRIGLARLLQRGQAQWIRCVGFSLATALSVMLAACATSMGNSGNVTSALSEQAKSEGAGQPRKPVRIGLLLPISGYGPHAITAKGMKQAAELALLDLNNPQVQLIVKDDKGTPEGALAAAQEAIGEGAEILIGPITAEGTRSAASVASGAGVPVLSFSNDGSVAQENVHLLGFSPEQEVERIVGFAASKGKRRFAALIPGDAYGQVVQLALQKAVQRRGGTLAAVTTFPRDANAMLDPVRMLASEVLQSADSATPIDALLVAADAEVLPQLDPILTYAGLNSDRVQILGTGAWDFANAGRNPAFVSGWYPGADPPAWRDFIQRFSRSFGQAPPRLASLSYDAVSFAITLASAEPGQRFTSEALARPAGFTGVDGPLRFKTDGVTERALAVLELQAFGGNVIDPAPPFQEPKAPLSIGGIRLPWQ